MTASVLAEVNAERQRQDEKWGEQNHPDFTGGIWGVGAAQARECCDNAFRDGYGSWLHILREEVAEAQDAAVDGLTTDLRAELVQVAAVAVAWVEAIDRRPKEQPHG